MKFQHSSIALALLAMGAAHAGTPITPAQAAASTNQIYVSGSSALRFSIGAAFLQNCDMSTVTVFGDGSGTSQSALGKNVRGYACTLATAIPGSYGVGTTVVVQKYDAGGSINGVQPLVNQTALQYLQFASCTSTGLVRSSTNFDLTQMDYACPQSSTGAVPQMGVSDVEAALIQNSVNLPSNKSAVSTASLTGGVHSVAMGAVAVNVPLYRALQAAQGKTQDDNPANAPTLPASFLSAAESGSAGPVNGNGWNSLIPSDGSGSNTDSAAQAVVFCSRTNGSGTKAMHSAFLLSAPCFAHALTPAGSNTATQTGQIETNNNDEWFQLNSSTGNVVSCLQNATTRNGATTLVPATLDANNNVTNANANQTSGSGGNPVLYTGWAFGMIGAEQSPFTVAGQPLASTNANSPFGVDSSAGGWRFVAINGAYPNRANAQIGAYPMTYENYMYWLKTGAKNAPTGNVLGFAQWLQNGAVTPAALEAVAVVDPGTGAGILSSTNTTYSSFTAPDNAFISRVTRGGYSCAPNAIVQ